MRLHSRTLTTFPSSASRRHPAVAGAIARRGGDPYERDGPAEASTPTCSREGARLPGDQGAFHHHEHELQQDFSWTPRAGLLFAPPTRSPQVGEKCRWSGIASLEPPAPEGPCGSRLGERAPLWTRGDRPFRERHVHLGLTTQAHPRGSADEVVGKDGMPCLFLTDRSALTASTTESPRPDVPRTS